MDFRYDWPLMAVVLLMFLLLGALFASFFYSDRRFQEFSVRCEKAGGTPINDSGAHFCVEKFADMRATP